MTQRMVLRSTISIQGMGSSGFMADCVLTRLNDIEWRIELVVSGAEQDNHHFKREFPAQTIQPAMGSARLAKGVAQSYIAQCAMSIVGCPQEVFFLPNTDWIDQSD